MKVFVKTYGCTFNQADSDVLKKELVGNGHELVSEAKADVVVLNTCSVKEATEQKILHKIKFEKKPVVVTGCLAQTSPELIKVANSKASIVGTFAQVHLPLAVEKTVLGERLELLSKQGFLADHAVVDGVIGRVRISRGCLSSCSFCSTKNARGDLVSTPITQLRQVVEELARQGVKEVDLASQDTGCYGFDLRTTAASLLERLNDVNGDFFIRLGMGNPQHFKRFVPELLAALSLPKVFKFLHVPVQSGSDSVLRAMKRGHTVKDFQKIALSFRKAFPNGLLATDLIVGFPGETNEDFRATSRLVEDCQIDFVNVSKYSQRPGTSAFALGKMDNRLVKQRSEELSELARKIFARKSRSLVGKAFNAVFLEKRGSMMAGRTTDYRPVLGEGFRVGEICGVEVTGFGPGHLDVARV